MKPDIRPTKEKQAKFLLALAILVVSVTVYLLGPLIWQLSFGRPGQAEFYLHHGKYQDIVSRVKAMPLAPGAQTTTHIDGLLVNAARNAAGARSWPAA